MSPAGHVLIESFHLDGRMPVWRYQIGDETVEMRIWMEPGATVLEVSGPVFRGFAAFEMRPARDEAPSPGARRRTSGA